jgi:molecular chaperone GrpE
MSDGMNEYNTHNGSAAAEKEAVESLGNEAAENTGAVDDAPSASDQSPSAQAATEGEVADSTTIAQLRADLLAEQRRFEELNDRFQRSAAEFQNTLRRREKQTNDTLERASQQVITKLLPVLDDFDRALQNLPENVRTEHASWLEGFQQIQKKLLQVIDDEGVVVIPLEGPFDPTLHEAITSEPSDTVESGHIIATLRVGYQQRGRVIRPALVRVAT